MNGLHIGIIGCGVSGLTAAIALARNGHRVELFEQSPAVGPIGAGVLLQPSGQLVLEALGLLDRVVANAAPIHRLCAVTDRGKQLTNLKYADAHVGRHAYGIHRGDLFGILHEAATAAGVTIHLSRRILRMTELKTRPQIWDEADQSAGPFDCVLVADGVRSTLRKTIDIETSMFPYPHGALWALGRCDAVTDHLFQVARGTRLLCGLLPMGVGRCSLFWSLENANRQALLDGGIDAWKQQVLEIAPQAESIVERLTDFSQVPYTTYAHVDMPRWYFYNCLLLGDAAHAMSPHLGQGINLGMLDGLTIARAIESESTIDRAFARYEKLRRPHTDFYARVTFALSPFFQSKGRVRGLMRDIGLPLMPYVPILRQQMLLTMTGMKRSAFGGMLKLP